MDEKKVAEKRWIYQTMFLAFPLRLIDCLDVRLVPSLVWVSSARRCLMAGGEKWCQPVYLGPRR